MGTCGGGTSADTGLVGGVWTALKDKRQGHQAQIGKRDVMELQLDPAGSVESWAGVVFHSWWPLWTPVCRLLNVSLFTLLTRDTLWTLDNCQQHSTPKTCLVWLILSMKAPKQKWVIYTKQERGCCCSWVIYPQHTVRWSRMFERKIETLVMMFYFTGRENHKKLLVTSHLLSLWFITSHLMTQRSTLVTAT